MQNLNFIEIIGLIAATLTTASFLPQVFKTWKTKDVSGLSLPMFSMFFIGVCLWIVYGIYKDSPSLIIGNSIAVINSFLLIYFKIKYDK